jgi:hypothetical protein
MSRLRASFPALPIALSSYRYPTLHPQLPWQAFLEKCDLNMPQVYWLLAHNPAEQLNRSVNEFQALVPFRPIIPVGAAFYEHNWSPAPEEVVQFMQTAQVLNLSAANFWEWANCRRLLLPVWDAIKNYTWGTLPAQDIAQRLITALNSHNVNLVTNLYQSGAVHVTSARTIQGINALKGWYTALLSQILPNATFTLTSFSGEGSVRHLNWTAASSAGNVNNGNDTLGIVNDQIAYHYTYFTIT